MTRFTYYSLKHTPMRPHSDAHPEQERHPVRALAVRAQAEQDRHPAARQELHPHADQCARGDAQARHLSLPLCRHSRAALPSGRTAAAAAFFAWSTAAAFAAVFASAAAGRQRLWGYPPAV